MPNITGRIVTGDNVNDGSAYANGAFTRGSRPTRDSNRYWDCDAGTNFGNSFRLFYMNFSALNSNSIYGASTKVQPNSLTMSYYIKF